MTKYFRDETGMYIDWKQLDKLPKIDTLIDIGVGPMGTPDLYKRFEFQYCEPFGNYTENGYSIFMKKEIS